MQTNRHRVSEVAVTSKHKTNKDDVKNDTRTAIKRLREHDNSDTELEIDDIVTGNNPSSKELDIAESLLLFKIPLPKTHANTALTGDSLTKCFTTSNCRGYRGTPGVTDGQL